ncbi:MAG: hypothetical protein HOO99_03930 [Hyphomicrobiaceae bacterium]|nr:hypothetical protein [Hyphomicrobiaceae bacterium]
MSYQRQKNIYLCDACGHAVVTQDRDEGVTPFMIACEHCKQSARSLFYACPQPLLAKTKPAFEWFKPSPVELDGICEPLPPNLAHNTRDHVVRGGLLMRPFVTVVETAGGAT